jgi:hypothetical protein
LEVTVNQSLRLVLASASSLTAFLMSTLAWADGAPCSIASGSHPAFTKGLIPLSFIVGMAVFFAYRRRAQGQKDGASR